MGRISELMEAKQLELRMHLRGAGYVDRHVHVLAGILEKIGVQFSKEALKSSFVKTNWAPTDQFYYTEQRSIPMLGLGTSRIARARGLKGFAVRFVKHELPLNYPERDGR